MSFLKKSWDSARNAAEKASLEVEKFARIKQEERAIAKLRQDLQAKYALVGERTIGLFRQEQITHSEVAALNKDVFLIEDLIKKHEKTIEEIQAEQWEDAQPLASPVVQPSDHLAAAGVKSDATVRCPYCGNLHPQTARFCPVSGAALRTGSIETESNAPSRSVSQSSSDADYPSPVNLSGEVPKDDSTSENTPGPAAQAAQASLPMSAAPNPLSKCINCQKSIPTTAVYCPECGAPQNEDLA